MVFLACEAPQQDYKLLVAIGDLSELRLGFVEVEGTQQVTVARACVACAGS